MTTSPRSTIRTCIGSSSCPPDGLLRAGTHGDHHKSPSAAEASTTWAEHANPERDVSPSTQVAIEPQGAPGRGSESAGAGRGRSAAQDPVHHLEQLVDLVLAAARPDLLADAAADVAVEQPERHLVEGGLDGRHLGDHVDAVLVLVDHAGHAPDLALDAAQAGLELLLLHGVAGHDTSSALHAPPGYRIPGTLGGYLGRCRREVAVAATAPERSG